MQPTITRCFVYWPLISMMAVHSLAAQQNVSTGKQSGASKSKTNNAGQTKVAKKQVRLGGSESGVARRIPPGGIDVDPKLKSKLLSDAKAQQQRFTQQLASLDAKAKPLAADVGIFAKAVQFAVEFNEFFNPKEVDLAQKLLEEGDRRLKLLTTGKPDWTTANGTVVRGYQSALDGSWQPYGLVIHKTIDFDKPIKLHVWLHGRAETTTDLAFIGQRMRDVGQIVPEEQSMVLHPYGRFCNAFKFAGEVDVLEAIAHVQQQYKIDANRVVIRGFSMGGAGCWSLAAHYPSMFAAATPGAGFVDTLRFQNMKLEEIPWYEQALLGLTDVPPYVRHLFQLPVFAYSGELDRQRAAAEIMAETFSRKGKVLDHTIGPKTEHKIHPDSLIVLNEKVQKALVPGRNTSPNEVTVQTRTVKYGRVHWLEIAGMREHWVEATAVAKRGGADSNDQLSITTSNVARLNVYPTVQHGDPKTAGKTDQSFEAPISVVIDGQSLKVDASGKSVVSLQRDQQGKWSDAAGDINASLMAKRPGLQGPIDDAFMGPFVFVKPSGKCADPNVQRWVDFEMKHALVRWKYLMRGEVKIVSEAEVNDELMSRYNLVLWGDRSASPLIDKFLAKLTIKWTEKGVSIADVKAGAELSPVLSMVYPNVLQTVPSRYIVLNSGITFREEHDTSNSLQNAKWPDWVIISAKEIRPMMPRSSLPGRIVFANFFDEYWQPKPMPQLPYTFKAE